MLSSWYTKIQQNTASMNFSLSEYSSSLVSFFHIHIKNKLGINQSTPSADRNLINHKLNEDLRVIGKCRGN